MVESHHDSSQGRSYARQMAGLGDQTMIYGFMPLPDGVYFWRCDNLPGEDNWGGPAKGPYPDMEAAKAAATEDGRSRSYSNRETGNSKLENRSR